MKKYLLSFSVILLSIFYVVWQNWSGRTQLNSASVISENGVSYDANSQNSEDIPVPTLENNLADDNSQNNATNPAPVKKDSNNTGSPQISNNSKTPNPAKNSGSYKNGQFTGKVVNAYYGKVQIKTTIQDGKIADVQFLDYPHDRSTSREINSQAMPILKSEAIRAQNAKVKIVSGATFTSQAFQQSLGSALNQAS